MAGILDVWEKLTGRTVDPGPGQGEGRSMMMPGGSFGGFGGGVEVTPSGALHNAAVFACVRVLAESVASLPLNMNERLTEGKRRAPDHHLHPILHDAPNEAMTSFQFRETLQGHLLLWGNAYCEIEYDARGRVRGLWPLRPDRMLAIERVDGREVYRYQLPTGEVIGLDSERVWHLRGLSADGRVGYSPIQLMARAVGVAQATEAFGAKFFENGARPGVILTHPGVIGDDALRRLREGWVERHGGLNNAHRVAILEEGMVVSEIGMPPQDAQFLETRKFQLGEIARIFRVPPHMIGDLERATFSNIEHQSIDFVVHTLRPWLVRWEQSISQTLMLAQERGRYYAEFVVDGLLRGDVKSRYEAYAVARQNGWMSANDIRNLENMNPIRDGGDLYLVPLNMAPAESVAAAAQGGEGRIARGEESEESEGRIARGEDVETRARASATSRAGLIGEFLPLFGEATGRVVRREVTDVRKAARRYLKGGDVAGFVGWLEAFYFDDHPGFVSRALGPVLASYGPAVVRAVAAELGREDGADVSEMTAAYLETYGNRWSAESRQRLSKRLREAQGEDSGLSDVEDLLDHWDDERAVQEARAESHRANNALARAAYAGFGVTKLRWVTLGDNCPYCGGLNGAVISITGNFAQAGQSLDGGEGRGPMTISTNVGNPPLHEGCDCMAVAG